MEKRLLLAIVLSFLVLFLYQLVFVKKQPSQEPPPEIPAEMQKSPQKKPVPEQSLESIEKSMAAEAQEESFQPVSEEREEQIIVDTPLYRAVWTNSGAQLKSWKLKKKAENLAPMR